MTHWGIVRCTQAENKSGAPGRSAALAKCVRSLSKMPLDARRQLERSGNGREADCNRERVVNTIRVRGEVAVCVEEIKIRVADRCINKAVRIELFKRNHAVVVGVEESKNLLS